MKPIYLCGPINGRTDQDCRDWRELAKSLWGGRTLDPMRRDYRGRELELGIAAEIVAGDIADIEVSAAMLVYYDKPSVGTAMEVFFAKAILGLPVVVVDVSGKPISPWLSFHSDVIVLDVASAIEALKSLVRD